MSSLARNTATTTATTTVATIAALLLALAPAAGAAPAPAPAPASSAVSPVASSAVSPVASSAVSSAVSLPVSSARASAPGRAYSRAARKATNAQRRAQGLKPLRTNACLTGFANRHAARMARERRMYHQELGPILSACGLGGVGENVAYGYPSGRAVVVQGWMNSPGHRENILRSSFRLMAVGARKGPDGLWYTAQVFGN